MDGDGDNANKGPIGEGIPAVKPSLLPASLNLMARGKVDGGPKQTVGNTPKGGEGPLWPSWSSP